jgi:RNA polymerase-binding transcription factor DksA
VKDYARAKHPRVTFRHGEQATATVIDSALREQLLERRGRLETAADHNGEESQLRRLLEEVDAALARMEEETFGLCQVCHSPVEAERIMTDPLVCVCLGCLSTA